MNRITEEILTEILQSEDAWDKKTRQLKYHHVYAWYLGARENRFYDEVLFPKMQRAARLCIALGFMPADKLVIEDDGDWWLDEEVSECLNDQLCDEQGLLYGPSSVRSGEHYRMSYISWWWYQHPDWAVEDPTEEEILALGIRPGYVPAKPGQPALF